LLGQNQKEWSRWHTSSFILNGNDDAITQPTAAARRDRVSMTPHKSAQPNIGRGREGSLQQQVAMDDDDE
jgi:hypothetical protein